MKSFRSSTLIALALLCTAGARAAGSGHDAHHESDAIGRPGMAARATRTVKVDMNDTMRFTPATVDVKQNETIRFAITNSGQLKHEWMLGTEGELKEHAEMMKKFPEMEHDDPNQISLAPGAHGEIVWTFTRAGKVDFACLQPGHYDAGMKGVVNVARARKR